MTMTPQEFSSIIGDGQFAFPGGYEKIFIMADSETICFDCADKEYKRIIDELRDVRGDKEWQPIACVTHWEGEPIICAHCNREIESEYGE